MQKSCDLIIIGGGVIGSSIAFNLLKDGYTGKIVVFEQDPAYEYASTPRSAGGIRQIFSSEVNIKMSQYGLEVYKNFEADMAIDGEQTPINFKQRGYLFLLNTKQLTNMKSQITLQKKLGVQLKVLSPSETKTLIPELTTSDLAGAVFSPEDGYMDPYSVMQAYVKQAKQLGAEYIYKKVSAILKDEKGNIKGVQVDNNERIEDAPSYDKPYKVTPSHHDSQVSFESSDKCYFAPIVVNACGAWSGDLSATVGAELPVSPLRRQIFFLDLATPFQNWLPLVVDTSGAYFRHEGKKVIAGFSNDVPYEYEFRWEKAFFEKEVWPLLANRCSNFDRLKLERGWAGLYDYNRIDQNAIIGRYSDIPGYYVASGFSGHGLQHAPAAGKALSELIRLGQYKTVDVSSLSPERFKLGHLLLEDAIV